jgi:hypothetical protein
MATQKPPLSPRKPTNFGAYLCTWRLLGLTELTTHPEPG